MRSQRKAVSKKTKYGCRRTVGTVVGPVGSIRGRVLWGQRPHPRVGQQLVRGKLNHLLLHRSGQMSLHARESSSTTHQSNVGKQNIKVPGCIPWACCTAVYHRPHRHELRDVDKVDHMPDPDLAAVGVPAARIGLALNNLDPKSCPT